MATKYRCEICHKLFVAAVRRRFCSRTCKDADKEGEERKCLQCGRWFKAEAEEDDYCSERCERKAVFAGEIPDPISGMVRRAALAGISDRTELKVLAVLFHEHRPLKVFELAYISRVNDTGLVCKIVAKLALVELVDLVDCEGVIKYRLRERQAAECRERSSLHNRAYKRKDG